MKQPLTPKESAEIASFQDTGKVITHRGRTYSLLNPPDDEKRVDSPFILRSQRGQYYALMRNRPNPTMLFGMGLYGGNLKCLPGWFTDKDGELKSAG